MLPEIETQKVCSASQTLTYLSGSLDGLFPHGPLLLSICICMDIYIYIYTHISLSLQCLNPQPSAFDPNPQPQTLNSKSYSPSGKAQPRGLCIVGEGASLPRRLPYGCHKTGGTNMGPNRYSQPPMPPALWPGRSPPVQEGFGFRVLDRIPMFCARSGRLADENRRCRLHSAPELRRLGPCSLCLGPCRVGQSVVGCSCHGGLLQTVLRRTPCFLDSHIFLFQALNPKAPL